MIKNMVTVKDSIFTMLGIGALCLIVYVASADFVDTPTPSHTLGNYANLTWTEYDGAVRYEGYWSTNRPLLEACGACGNPIPGMPIPRGGDSVIIFPVYDLPIDDSIYFAVYVVDNRGLRIKIEDLNSS